MVDKAWVRRADGMLTGWVDSAGSIFDATGDYIIGGTSAGIVIIGGSRRILGHVYEDGRISMSSLKKGHKVLESASSREYW